LVEIKDLLMVPWFMPLPWNDGMMEQWNTGFKGMKPIEIDDFLLFMPNIPVFHHSIIPIMSEAN